MAHPNRNHRSRSIAYDRCVAAERPEACSSCRNAVTATTGSPSLSISRTGSHRSPPASTAPTARHHQHGQITIFTDPVDHGRGT